MIRCSCGWKARFVSYRKRTILSSAGSVTVCRAYYHCRHCGHGQAPYDQASGWGSMGLSQAVAAAGCLLSAQSSFAEASETLQHLWGLRVDDNLLQAAAHRAGQAVLDGQDQAIAEAIEQRRPPASVVHPERLYVSTDGATALTRDGWREVKCGAVYWDDPVEGHQARYVGRIETCESSGRRLWHLACQHGLREANEVVVIGDGAPWIWNQADLHFSRARQVLDWYHASQHVWACANELHGEGTKKARQWAKRMLDVLYEQGGQELLKRLWQSRNARRHPPTALTDLIGYITPNVDRMNYPQYRADGLHIGSGPIECTCKRLVGGRLKGPGMRWTVPGADAVLALRTVWLNGQWTDFWNTKPLVA